MKCYVYAFYNKLVGAYEKPIINNFPQEDFSELVVRDILVSDNAAKVRMQECQLFYLGKYDDKLAKFELESQPDFILDVGSLINGVKPKESAKDGECVPN